ncbi:hypothetical protein JW906_09660 [bacterium]|nr:hypothetical protein [bacterium]
MINHLSLRSSHRIMQEFTTLYRHCQEHRLQYTLEGALWMFPEASSNRTQKVITAGKKLNRPFIEAPGSSLPGNLRSAGKSHLDSPAFPGTKPGASPGECALGLMHREISNRRQEITSQEKVPTGPDPAFI